MDQAVLLRVRLWLSVAMLCRISNFLTKFILTLSNLPNLINLYRIYICYLYPWPIISVYKLLHQKIIRENLLSPWEQSYSSLYKCIKGHLTLFSERFTWKVLIRESNIKCEDSQRSCGRATQLVKRPHGPNLVQLY